jgi:hypothetical protein
MNFRFCDSNEFHVGFGMEPERNPTYISGWCIRRQSTATNMEMVRNYNFMPDSCMTFGIFRHTL